MDSLLYFVFPLFFGNFFFSHCFNFAIVQEEIDMARAESDKEPNTCKQCGVTFKKPAYLKQHMQSHSLEVSISFVWNDVCIRFLNKIESDGCLSFSSLRFSLRNISYIVVKQIWIHRTHLMLIFLYYQYLYMRIV